MTSYSVNVTECPVSRTIDYPNYELYARIVKGYMTTICVLLGTIGNLHGVKCVHNANLDKNRGVVLAVSILALAFWDTILLWCAFFYYGVMHLPGASNSDLFTVVLPWFHGFSQTANCASIWCVVAITMQRYMATRDPFRATRSATLMHSFRSERRVSTLSFIYCSTYRRLFRLPLLLSIFAIAVNIPAFFEMGTKACYLVMEDRLALKIEVLPLRKNRHYIFWYKVLFRMLVTTVGPNLFILFVTLFTVYLLRVGNRSRRQLFHMSDSLLDRYSSRETMQTMISVMLVTKFLLFRSPCFVLDIMEIAGMFKETSIPIYVLIDMSNFLILLNSATNCLIFLKASNWLNNKIVERKTMKRKKTECDTVQLFGDRSKLLTNSWFKAMRMTNGQLGLRVLYSMLRKHPALFDIFRNQQQVYPYTHAKLSTGSPIPQQPPTPPPTNCRRSFDIITNTRYQEVADRITSFISEILEMIQTGQSEQYIIVRIRRVGAVHFDKGIHFPSAVWREFKSSMLCIIAECEYATNSERERTMEAWGTFLSLIIREMKTGTWVIGESIGTMS